MFIWPGKVMSCLAHLAGGPIVIVSILARLTILPWGNCKTYSISYSWWILCVPKVWPLLEDHVDAISKHVCGTLIFNKYIWSPMLNVSCPIIQTPLYGYCHEICLPYLNGFYFLSRRGYLALLDLGKGIPLVYVSNTFSFPLFCLIWWSHFIFHWFV